MRNAMGRADHRPPGATGRPGEEDPREEQLRQLFEVAFPPVTPSERLRRRVTVANTRHAAPAAQREMRPARSGIRSLLSVSWRPAVALAAAVFLVGVSGRLLMRPDRSRSREPGATSRADTEHPARQALAGRSAQGNGVPTPERPAERPPVNGGPVRLQSRLKAAAGAVPALDSQPALAGFTGRQAPRLRGDTGAAQFSAVDDLIAMNGSAGPAMRPWVVRPRAEREAIQERLRGGVGARDDFVTIPFPRLAAASDGQVRAAVESYRREAAVVDSRLAREVSVQQKATALADLCDDLRSETGIRLEAGRSVADEKVTLFCRQLPLRDVMRQLSRPFGYTWLRSGRQNEYRYELVQDLRSQLLEEELRNRDRDEALLALEKEIARYRPYLDLSPEQALARSRTARPAEKALLEKLAGQGWGPIQMYFRLSPRDLAALRAGQMLTFNAEPISPRYLAALRAGQMLTFSADPKPDQQPLPPDVARGVLQIYRDLRIPIRNGRAAFGSEETDPPDGFLPPASVPEARGIVTLTLKQSELGRFAFDGESGVGFLPTMGGTITGNGPYATGVSPAVLAPENAAANAKLARDPALRRLITVRPRPSCGVAPGVARSASPPTRAEAQREPPVTSADVLEALHQTTSLPIVADYYTRLYKPGAVSVRNLAGFDALNRLADAMRLRWNKEGSWLQFRSASYYDDRLKEVPNQLLSRWASSHRQQGALTLDDLLQIAQLSDAQLDATAMAEGVRECFGLTEWDMARHPRLRPHLRCLALLTPAQRQAAMSPAGLAFTRMTLAQQQQFVTRAIGWWVQSLEELMEATLHVGYTQPGGFAWKLPDGPFKGPVELPLVRERTWEAALQAARRVDPQVGEAQIAPSELAITVAYTRGSPQTGRFTLVTQTTPHGFIDRFYRSRPDRGEEQSRPKAE
jgi:hypothetical protein